jgi:hypothetical protein
MAYDQSDRQLLEHIHELLHKSQTYSDPSLVDLARRVGALEARVMGLKEDLQAAMTAIDEKTTALGARIDAIVVKLKNPSITPEDRDAALAHLSAIGVNLEAMAKDPIDPVPEPSPLPPV